METVCLNLIHLWKRYGLNLASPGLGKMAIPDQARWEEPTVYNQAHSLDRLAPPSTIGSGDESILMKL